MWRGLQTHSEVTGDLFLVFFTAAPRLPPHQFGFSSKYDLLHQQRRMTCVPSEFCVPRTALVRRVVTEKGFWSVACGRTATMGQFQLAPKLPPAKTNPVQVSICFQQQLKAWTDRNPLDGLLTIWPERSSQVFSSGISGMHAWGTTTMRVCPVI